MKTLEVYDPPMCCSTGVCGTDVDPKLVQFSLDLAWLVSKGVVVRRFGLAQEPAAFATHPGVNQALREHGNGCLPLVLVEGTIATRSIYPTRDQLAALTGVNTGSCQEDESDEGCCGGGANSCCC